MAINTMNKLEKRLHEKCERQQKEIDELKKHVSLAKKTIIAFSDSHLGGKQGHKSWCKAIAHYNECLSVMDLSE